MNWKVKALVQKAFSNIPGGTDLNYFCQRFITKTAPGDDNHFAADIVHARHHWQAFKPLSRIPMANAVFYEFGAGAALTVPLALYAFGADRQVVVDIRPLARSNLVNDSVERFKKLGVAPDVARLPDRRVGEGKDLVSSLKVLYGIDYRAPYDTRNTGIRADSIDFITSTNTLQVIPLSDLRTILEECHRILRGEGLMSFHIDYQDRYSAFDSRIGRFHFLKYSEKAYSLYNSALQYQNRLRHSDYLALFKEAKFEVLREVRIDGSDSDVAGIASLPPSAEFQKYSYEELAVLGSYIVLGKSPRS